MNRILLLLAGWLLPLSAFAGIFDPGPGDKSLEYLGDLFGAVAGGASNGGATMGAMFGILNQAMLGLGAVIMAYTLVAGVMQTAHDGEMLGKRYSSLWVPIRTVTAIAMIIPMGTSGYAPVQELTIWVAKQGIGLADTTWNAGIGGLMNSGPIVAVPPSSQTGEVAAKVFKSLVCVAAANKAIAAAGETASPLGASTSSVGNGGVQILFGGSSPGYPADMCGGVKFENFNSLTGGQAGTNDTESIIAAHVNALNQMITSLQPVAQALVSGQGVQPGAVTAAAQQYESYVRNAVAGVISSKGSQAASEFKSNATAEGWVTAGAWYHKISDINDKVAAAAMAKPTTIDPDPPTTLGIEDVTAAYAGKADKYLRQDGEAKPGVEAGYNADSGDGVINTVFNGIGLGIAHFLTTVGNGSAVGTATINPIIQMKNMGDYIIDAGDTAMIAYIGARSLSGAADGSLVGKVANWATGVPGAIKAGLQAAGPIIMLLIVSLFFFGITLSIYVPLIPYIQWIGAVISWLVTVFEAMVAAPLWAILHLNPEGEGIGNRTENGYIFLAALVLRPVLSIIGFICSSELVIVIGKYVNETFMTTVAGMQAGHSFTGVVSIVGIVAAYVGICLMIVNKSFALIHIVPDRILQWIGNASAPGMHDAEGEAEKVFVGGATHGRGAVERNIGRDRTADKSAPKPDVSGSQREDSVV